jgi:hypothetical protein
MKLKQIVYTVEQVIVFQIHQCVLMKDRYIHSKDNPVSDSSCSSSLVIRTKIYLITRQKSTIKINIEEYQIMRKANGKH